MNEPANSAQCKIVVYFLYGCNNGDPNISLLWRIMLEALSVDCALDLDSAFTV